MIKIGGTSSPSPAGSTYTTASESGTVTYDSELGNYLSASEDPANAGSANAAVVSMIPVLASNSTTMTTAVEAIMTPTTHSYETVTNSVSN